MENELKKLMGSVEAGTRKSNFTDVQGREWRPRLTTPILLEICRVCDINLNKLTDMNLNLADLFEALWIACRWKATMNGEEKKPVSRDDFFAAVPPSLLPEALGAMWSAVLEAFPAMAKSGADEPKPKEGDEVFVPGK